MKKTYYYDIVETPLGWVGVLASSVGIRRTTLPHQCRQMSLQHLKPEVEDGILNGKRFTKFGELLSEYFKGLPVSFQDAALDLNGASPFLRAAWEACQRIPRGQTRSYKWLASQTGRPKASRAAGQAMAKNWLPIIVPCHRVISSNGDLVGFGGNDRCLVMKKQLLELESTYKVCPRD